MDSKPEIVINKATMIKKNEKKIEDVYKMVYNKKILPSMRSLQFGGKPIEISPNRVYNCAYLPLDHIDSFSEIMFLLLGGTGVGYSVQKHHVAKLPPVNKPYAKRKRRFLIGDSILPIITFMFFPTILPLLIIFFIK